MKGKEPESIVLLLYYCQMGDYYVHKAIQRKIVSVTPAFYDACMRFMALRHTMVYGINIDWHMFILFVRCGLLGERAVSVPYTVQQENFGEKLVNMRMTVFFVFRGSYNAMVVRWTADQKVERLILHLGHFCSYQNWSH